MENVPPTAISHTLGFILYYVFKILPTLIAGMCIYLGYRLFILGVTGQASLSLESHKVSGQLLNAAPGLFFAVGGVIALIISVCKGVQISFDRPNGSRAIAYNVKPEL